MFPGGKAFQVALKRSCTSSLMFFAQVLQAFAHRFTMCSLAFGLGKGLQVVAVTLATTEKHMTEVQHTAEPCKKKIKDNLHYKKIGDVKYEKNIRIYRKKQQSRRR